MVEPPSAAAAASVSDAADQGRQRTTLPTHLLTTSGTANRRAPIASSKAIAAMKSNATVMSW